MQGIASTVTKWGCPDPWSGAREGRREFVVPASLVPFPDPTGATLHARDQVTARSRVRLLSLCRLWRVCLLLFKNIPLEVRVQVTVVPVSVQLSVAA